jgi:hypothetical protein
MDRPEGSVEIGGSHARSLAGSRVLASALAFMVASAGLAVPVLAAGPGSTPAPTKTKRAPAPAKPLGTAIVQWDHLVDSDDTTFEDFWAFLSYKQAHVQAWYGDFTKGGEVGGYLKDGRRSTYAGLYRYRKDFDHVVQFDTEQILKKGFVAAGMLRGIHVIPDNAPGDRNMIQFGAGMDYYWGDYNFLSVRAISDPREGGRWTFVASHRFQRDLSFYIQPGVILHTDGSAGWFLQGRYRIFRWGAGKYDRFDFTDVDRTVYSAGLEWTY